MEFLKDKLVIEKQISMKATIADLLYHVVTDKFFDSLKQVPHQISNLNDLLNHVYAVDIRLTDDTLHKFHIEMINAGLAEVV